MKRLELTHLTEALEHIETAGAAVRAYADGAGESDDQLAALKSSGLMHAFDVLGGLHEREPVNDPAYLTAARRALTEAAAALKSLEAELRQAISGADE